MYCVYDHVIDRGYCDTRLAKYLNYSSVISALHISC